MSSSIDRGRRRAPRALGLALVCVVALVGLSSCDSTDLQVRGTVRSEAGTELVGVEVALFADEDTPVFTTASGLSGGFEVRASAGLADGIYRLKVAGDWWPEGSDYADAATVEVAAGLPEDAVTVTLTGAEASIAGVVVDDADQAVADASVVVLEAGTGKAVSSTRTGTDGSFGADVLVASDHRIYVAHPDHDLVAAGGSTPKTFGLASGRTDVGTVDITTGAVTPPIPTYQAVVAGWEHTCGHRLDGTVTCWGMNGPGTSPSGTFKAITAGSYASCGIRTDDTVACWTHPGSTITAPSGTFTALDATFNYLCGIGTDQRLVCTGDVPGPATMPSFPVASVHSGFFARCVVDLDDAPSCEGLNNHGEGVVPGDVVPSTMALGAEWGCGLRADDTVRCWGKSIPASNPPTGTFTSLVTGPYHACGLRTDGTVSCWGENGEGQLNAPTGTYKSLGSGVYHTCAIAGDDTLRCWGLSNRGQAVPPTA